MAAFEHNNDGVPAHVSYDNTSRLPRDEMRQATLLIIAGFDPSGGAGILADARIATQLGFHAAGVVTGLTEQDSQQCAWMHPAPPQVISDQLARLVDDFDIRAVKIGMLANAAIVEVVAHVLRRPALRAVPVVLDPVLRATRGVALLEGAAATVLRSILPLATVVTPNVNELATITGASVHDLVSMRQAARDLRRRGPLAVLAKGGHLEGEPTDVLVDGDGALDIPGERVEGPTPHGTGCALSTELACRLALGMSLRDASIEACARVRQRIAEPRSVGRGRPFLG